MNARSLALTPLSTASVLHSSGLIGSRSKPTQKPRNGFYINWPGKKRRQPDATFLAEDEAALIAEPTTARLWAKRGEQPVIPMAWSGRPERRTLFGATNLKTGKLLGKIAKRGNTATFHEFLESILQRFPRGAIILILDNVRFHHAKALRAFRKKRRRLRFLFLPPYQPKLNPQEMVWQIMRRTVTHNRYYKTFAAQQRAAHAFFKEQTIKFLNTPTSLIIRK